MTGVFLQARMDSVRLPEKALLPLENLTVIEHAMRSLVMIPADIHLLLTDSESTALLGPFARKWGFTVFTGPKNDVLRRFSLASREFGVDLIIRATGDNPLVSTILAEELMKLHQQEGADRSGFIGPPVGTGVEIVSASALLAADDEALDSCEREHVTPFLYRRPERFMIYLPPAPEEWCCPDGRVTLDTEEDYTRLKVLYRRLYRGAPIPISILVEELKNHDTGRSR